MMNSKASYIYMSVETSGQWSSVWAVRGNYVGAFKLLQLWPSPSHRPQVEPGHWEFWKLPGRFKCAAGFTDSCTRQQKAQLCDTAGLLQAWLMLGYLGSVPKQKQDKTKTFHKTQKSRVTAAYLCSPVTFKSFGEHSSYAPDSIPSLQSTKTAFIFGALNDVMEMMPIVFILLFKETSLS